MKEFQFQFQNKWKKHTKIQCILNSSIVFCNGFYWLTSTALHHVVAVHCCVEERSECIVVLGRWYRQRPIVIVLYCCYWLLWCQPPLNRLKIRSTLRLFDEYSKHALVLVVVERFDRCPFSYLQQKMKKPIKKCFLKEIQFL